ncbi:unnamed protein product [Nippostrongylus brasiliensis]|uniref:Protein ECT2 (inferred by orthology to a human protein) n=1 Tax=Nippostrongylus brasiliensis TaxID=27835 RepID=A0A0N4YA41_NIPBR|nr:unnamed protein product [Nippostrongylus brasiliensis]
MIGLYAPTRATKGRNSSRRLEIVQIKVKDALLERVAKNKPVMKEATIKQIFGKIKPIVEIHERICSELKDLMDNFDEKGRHIAEIWKNVSYELLRIYPAYTNYCDMARLMFVSECEKNAKLRSFIEELEKDPAFNRQKIADIMVIPVQRLAGVKLLLEKLQKKSARRQRVAIQSAIDKVSDVLSQSNTIRMNSDKYMASLSLFAQVDSIPVKLVKSSNDMIISVDGRLLCGTEKLDIKDNTKIKLVLFKDATVLGCGTALVASKGYDTTPRSFPDAERSASGQSTIADRWKRAFGTNTILLLENQRGAERYRLTSRWLRHNGMMTFAEVPTECQAILKRELTEKGYITEELDEVSTPVRNGVKHMAQMFGLGNMSEVFHSRSTTVKKAKIDGHLTLHFQSNLEDPPGFGHLNSTPVRRRLVYPAE